MGYVLAQARYEMGGDRVREVPDNVIPFPVPPRVDVADKLDAAIREAFAEGDKFADELKTLLQKWGFKASYIEAVVPELMEAYMNDDERPIWNHPAYRPEGVDVDADS